MEYTWQSVYMFNVFNQQRHLPGANELPFIIYLLITHADRICKADVLVISVVKGTDVLISSVLRQYE